MDEWTHPEQHIEHCIVCGGEIKWPQDEVGEMHDPAMYDPSLTKEEQQVAQETIPNNGIVHVQCGLDKGWVVS